MGSTVRVRDQWAKEARRRAGGIAGIAEKLGVDQSTVSRQLSGKSEPGPRFIGAVLTGYCVPFDDAFEVVDLPPIRSEHRTKGGKPASRLAQQADALAAAAKKAAA